MAFEWQVIHVPSIVLCWSICCHNCLDWGPRPIYQLQLPHQSRASYDSWVNSSSLKRSVENLHVCFSQSWRCEWSLARGRSILAKLVRSSSHITSLHISDKPALAAWSFIVCNLFLSNEMVISLMWNVRHMWVNICSGLHWHACLASYRNNHGWSGGNLGILPGHPHKFQVTFVSQYKAQPL